MWYLSLKQKKIPIKKLEVSLTLPKGIEHAVLHSIDFLSLSWIAGHISKVWCLNFEVLSFNYKYELSHKNMSLYNAFLWFIQSFFVLKFCPLIYGSVVFVGSRYNLFVFKHLKTQSD